MPIIQSRYRPPIFYHRHLSTIYRGRLRFLKAPAYERERIIFAPNDFLDLDWLAKGNEHKLVIILHGLEGSSESQAVISTASYFQKLNYDILVPNWRGCSGEPNKQLASYTSGSSDQLSCIIDFVLRNRSYAELYLLGISVGGNITLKYLGENGSNLDPRIKRAVAVSVPCDLAGSARKLAKLENRLYLKDFLSSLKSKTLAKKHQLGYNLDYKSLKRIKTFEEFDTAFTAPIHGFSSLQDYYSKSSSINYLDKIRIPTLLLTARDDPFLSESCFPDEIAQQSKFLFLEAPSHGGHVAFPTKGGGSWMESRSREFFELSNKLQDCMN